MFDFTKKNQIMGILNVTPDSFSDGGGHNELNQAVAHGKYLVESGADIIDIGGQSTRPGYVEVSATEELARILPVIKALKAEIKVPISVDTYYPEVAQAVIEAGVEIINDIKGMDMPGMPEVLAKYPNVGVVIMHSRLRTQQPLVEDIQNFYTEKVAECDRYQISHDRICFDPGLGFHKSVEENLAILRNPEAFCYQTFPILYGVSRKRTIGAITGEKIAAKRDYGSVQASLHALTHGATIVRVHEVAGMKQTLLMHEALL